MDKSEQQQLSDDERRLLAREIAADQHQGVSRGSFVAGWDAAMQSVSQETEPHCATCRCEGRSYAEDTL